VDTTERHKRPQRLTHHQLSLARFGRPHPASLAIEAGRLDALAVCGKIGRSLLTQPTVPVVGFLGAATMWTYANYVDV
jgi:hypothetical protein